MNEQNTNVTALVGKDALLAILFTDPKDRPTTRWLDNQCRLHRIPFIRVGRLIWFDAAQVKAAFLANASKFNKQ